MMPRIIPIGEELPSLDGEAHHVGRGKGSKPKGKAGERFQTLNAFVDFSMVGLGRVAICVWLILYRDTRDGTARTSMDDMARRAGCARRNIVRAVKQLEAAGLLKVVYRGGLRRGVSRYRVKALAKDG